MTLIEQIQRDLVFWTERRRVAQMEISRLKIKMRRHDAKELKNKQ